MSEHQRCVCCGTPLDNDGREVADGRTHTDGQCLDYVRAALGATKRALTTAERELAEARATIEASDTTRREWEVRAATSYAAGRAAGLRELVLAVEEAPPCDSDCMGNPERVYADYLCRRCRALCAVGEAITPDVLAAVEAVRRLGHWRNVLAVIDPNSPLATVSIVQARTERDRAHESLDAIADRLAARKGE